MCPVEEPPHFCPLESHVSIGSITMFLVKNPDVFTGKFPCLMVSKPLKMVQLGFLTKGVVRMSEAQKFGSKPLIALAYYGHIFTLKLELHVQPPTSTLPSSVSSTERMRPVHLTWRELFTTSEPGLWNQMALSTILGKLYQMNYTQ